MSKLLSLFFFVFSSFFFRYIYAQSPVDTFFPFEKKVSAVVQRNDPDFLKYDEDKSPGLVKSFRSSRLINVQTTESIPDYGLEFSVMHRFGVIQPNETLVTTFLGMDLPSNIKLALAYPFTDRLYVSVGRSKFNKVYDIEAKYVIFRQLDDGSMPISLAAYFSPAVATSEFPSIPVGAVFGNGEPFENRFNHRMLYNTQLIVSRQFFPWLSLQLATVFIYRNLAPTGRSNFLFALPASGAVRLGLSSSLIFEYNYVINEVPENNLYPFSIGYEIGTAGHKFQFFLSTTQQIVEYYVYTLPPVNYLEGNFLLGFNIKRTF